MPPPSAPCLLLVDDDPLVRMVLTMGLQDKGFDVTEAATAEAALVLLEHGLQPMAVVSDIDLGQGYNGIELADRLAHSHPGLPVVLISGRLSPDLSATGKHRAFLPKPFMIEALVRLLEH
jgi:CheY-like chemotaxis protein